MFSSNRAERAVSLWSALGDEGFRLFFPLGALYAAVWPLQWILVFDLGLPGVRTTPAFLWHGHEMIFGMLGAALIGFMTTAVPEWTDTGRLRGRALYGMALLWLGGRLVGFWGVDALVWLGAACDLGWLVWLLYYVAGVSLKKRTDRLLAFVVWLVFLLFARIMVAWAFDAQDPMLAQAALYRAGFAFLGLLGLVLARVSVPITNLVLDPTEGTTPYRPHPGRQNLAPGLVVVLLAANVSGLSPTVQAWLSLAAGAAFLDRVGEAFIGRAIWRPEILMLAAASLFAGLGLGLLGLGALGLPIAPAAGLHVAFMGGLGLGVLAVFSIAGLLHAGLPLAFAPGIRLAGICLVLAMAARTLPGLGLAWSVPGTPYAWAAVFWAAGFLLWLRIYWPIVSSVGLQGQPSVS